MNELIQQTGAILKQSQELLKVPGVKETFTCFLGWMGKNIFSQSKTAQERLILIEQQHADADTIAILRGNLEFLLEGNEKLQKELNEKVVAIQAELKHAGINISKTNTVTITGNYNKAYQDISNSTISDNSLNQTHSGSGDNVGRDKIVNNIYINTKDYQEFETKLSALQKRKSDCQARIDKYPDDESFRQDLLSTDNEIKILKSEVESFKQDVFRLYDTFTNINISTERLRLAKSFFDEGKFREADAILKAEEMGSDLSKLKERDKQLDAEKDEIQKGRGQIANEFLIKAQLWTTFYSEPDWFERTVDIYEKALDAARNVAIVFQYAIFLYKHNKFNQAQPLYEEALQIYRELARENPQTYLPDVAMTLNNLAVLHTNKNELNEAFEKHQEALQIRRELAKENPATYLPDVAMTLNNLAVLHKINNEFGDAIEKHQEALQIRRALAKENSVKYLPDVAVSLNNLANIYWNKSEFGEALEKHQEALQIRRALAKENPGTYFPDVAETLLNLALLQKAKNEFDEALEKYQEALQIYRLLAKENPGTYLPDVAITLNNLSIYYLQAVPDSKKSIALAIESLEIAKQFPEHFLMQQIVQKAILVLKANGIIQKNS